MLKYNFQFQLVLMAAYVNLQCMHFHYEFIPGLGCLSINIGMLINHNVSSVLNLTSSDIAAFPDSVNVLDNVSGDVRTPDKLIDGVNDTQDGRHMWLAPVLPGLVRKCVTEVGQL